MKYNRYGFTMSDDGDDDTLPDDKKKKKDDDNVEYQFDGYDVEINVKVALLPKTIKNKPHE